MRISVFSLIALLLTWVALTAAVRLFLALRTGRWTVRGARVARTERPVLYGWITAVHVLAFLGSVGAGIVISRMMGFSN